VVRWTTVMATPLGVLSVDSWTTGPRAW
jgi:hypothetical protein